MKGANLNIVFRMHQDAFLLHGCQIHTVDESHQEGKSVKVMTENIICHLRGRLDQNFHFLRGFLRGTMAKDGKYNLRSKIKKSPHQVATGDCSLSESPPISNEKLCVSHKKSSQTCSSSVLAPIVKIPKSDLEAMSCQKPKKLIPKSAARARMTHCVLLACMDLQVIISCWRPCQQLFKNQIFELLNLPPFNPTKTRGGTLCPPWF